jgi:DNA segregation ATPase FtsK/SpoIIIE-like protein
MERRYKLLHANGARNIGDFNRKVADGKPLRGPRETLATQAGITKEQPFEDGAYHDGILPYIVLVVDELADLMLTVQGEIETPLAILAQKARAIGIHLLLATQRPSVNVITGLIKAELPCRIAFRVSAKVDNRLSSTRMAPRRCSGTATCCSCRREERAGAGAGGVHFDRRDRALDGVVPRPCLRDGGRANAGGDRRTGGRDSSR